MQVDDALIMCLSKYTSRPIVLGWGVFIFMWGIK